MDQVRASEREILHEPRNADRQRSEALTARRLSERGADECLPDAGCADDDHVLLCSHPCTRRELPNDHLVEAATRVADEVLKPLPAPKKPRGKASR